MKQNTTLIRLDWDSAEAYAHLTVGDTLCQALEAGKRGCALGVADADGRPVAAATALWEGGELDVTSLLVEEPSRNRGAGTQLLQALQFLAKKMGCTHLCAEYPFPKLADLEAFLTRRGFRQDQTGNHIFYFPMEQIRPFARRMRGAVAARGQLLPISQLPQPILDPWRILFGATIAPELTPAGVGGEPLDAASLAYVYDGAVRGHTICTRLDAQTVYLGAVHTQEGHAKAAIVLLYETLALLSETDAQTLCVAGATEAGLQLIRHFSRDIGAAPEEQVMHRAILTGGGQTDMPEIDWSQVGYSILVPRLNGLQAQLEELGFPSDLVISEDHLPHLLVEDGKWLLNLTFLPLGAEADNQFLLNLWTSVPVQTMDDTQWHVRCAAHNMHTLGPVALYDTPSASVSLRATLPQCGGLAETDQLALFLQVFRQSLSALLTP